MSTTVRTTFAVPASQGARLRALAKSRGKPVSELLSELIDTFCNEAGIPDVTPVAAIELNEATGTYVLTLFGAYRVSRSAVTLHRLATALDEVADKGGVEDGPNYVVFRKGAGVMLGIEAKRIEDGETIAASLSMSPTVAGLIAKAIRNNITN